MMTRIAIGHQQQWRHCCRTSCHLVHATNAADAEATSRRCCRHHQHRAVHQGGCRAGIAAVCRMLYGQPVEGHIQYAAAVVAVTGIIAADVAAAAAAGATHAAAAAAAISKNATTDAADVAAASNVVVAYAA